MDSPHTTEPHGDGHVNPEVQYERSDVEARGILQFGAGLGVLIVGTVVAMWLLFRLVNSLEAPRKESDLPRAVVDQERGLPPIPLEGIEDVRDGKPRLLPPRAAEYTGPREQQLRQGNAAQGVLPIDKAMAELAGQLKATRGAEGPPRSYMIRLPSKAASGRVETGGQ
jgi:hypothetical protein